MLPINNIQSGPLIAHTTNVNNDKLLIDQWRVWVKNGIQGENEEREVALYRLVDCLKRDATDLNIDHLHLTSLPSTLPPSIKQLNICGNPLTSLESDKLPQSLRYLILSNSQIPLLSADLLSKVPHIEVRDGHPPFIIDSTIVN